MNSHAVFLPAVALINPTGVGVRPLIGHGRPGEAAQIGKDQADVASPAVLRGHINDFVGDGAADQTAVLAVLTVGAGDLVGGRKLTVHPDVSLQVSQTGKHLRSTGSEQVRSHRVHVSLMRHHYFAKEQTNRNQEMQLHGAVRVSDQTFLPR